MTDALGGAGATHALPAAKVTTEPSLLFQPILELFASDGMLLLGRSRADGPWRPLVSIRVQCRWAEIVLDKDLGWQRRTSGAGFWRQPRSGGQLKLSGVKILDGTPAGCEVGSAICGLLKGEAERQYLVVLVRQGDDDPFTNDAAEKLRSYAPHLRTLLELGLSARQEQKTALYLKQTIDALSPAIFGTDAQARVWLTNVSADEYLSEGQDFRVGSGVLEMNCREATHELHQGIWRAAQDAGSLPRGYLELDVRKPDRPEGLRVLVRPLQHGSDEHRREKVLVIVPGAREGRLLEHLMSRFDLTLAEAKLAHRLAGGASLKEAAGALGIREQTARTYLKRVFHKTETGRQAELVHKIAVEPLVRSHDKLAGPSAHAPSAHALPASGSGWQTEQ